MGKPRKQSSSQRRGETPSGRNAASSAQTGSGLSRGRLWLFRLVALTLPFLALGLVEVTLRLAGYGYSTRFFKEREIGGQRCLISNESFTMRFFPPELARWPNTFKFAVNKPAGVRRIFVFGESAAMGDPQPAFSASRYLEVLLRERFPAEKFEVINLGITAINSHVILPMARECARRGDGDIWIIYMGNNEMVGPFGAATVFGSRAPPRAVVRLYLASQRMRTGQLLVAGIRNLGGKPKNTVWGGMRMFLENQIAPDDPRKETVYANFAANLQDIVAAGQNAGAQVILSTMSVNLRDSPPFASLSDSNRPALELQRFAQVFAEAKGLQQQSNWLAATGQFAAAVELDPMHAETHFRLAESRLALADVPGAREAFQRACDLDALPFRADTRINAAIRELTRTTAGQRLVFGDAEAALMATSPVGIAGQESFFEHVHFNFAGNYRLGKVWAEHVVAALPAAAVASTPDWAAQEICDRNLGLTIWNRSFVLDSVVRRMQQPPLSSQFNNAARLASLQAELKQLREQQTTNAVYQAGQALVDAIQRAPHDALLLEGFANFLEAVGDLRQAAATYQKMLELLPHDFYAKQQLGRLHRELGELAQGEALLQQAARERASVPEVWTELGNVQMGLKQYAAALESYSRGLKLRPRDPVFLCHQANAFAKLERRAEAMATYRQALQLQPDLAEAHFELAGLLVAENQVAEAVREYAEAIRLNPRHAVSRINFGVVLVRLGRLDEAIQQFEVALQLDPRNAAAAEYLRQVTEQRSRGRQKPG